MKNLFAMINDNIEAGTNLFIVTKRLSLKAFYQLLPAFQKCHSIKIIFNDPQVDEQTQPAKALSYEINQVQANLLTHEFELNLKQDLLDPYKAQVIKKFIEDHVEIRVSQKTWSFSCLLFISKTKQASIAYCDEINLNSLGLTEKPSDQAPFANNDKNFIKYSKTQFEKYWLSQELTRDFKDQLLQKLADLFENKTPEFLYNFSLMHIFSNRLKEYENGSVQRISNYKESQIYRTLYDFQKTAVEAIIEKINLHNGCILADAVGLGKTYEALAVIKYFELQGKNTLVLTPKKLHVNWERFNKNYENNLFQGKEKFNYQILNHTDLTRTKGYSDGLDLSKHVWSNYDLVVIDESHNFRNRSLIGESQEEAKIKNQRYDFLLKKVIQEGRQTAVLLLSATPVNNRMQDISNQISLITADQDDFFSQDYQIKSVKNVCTRAENQAQKWTQLNKRNRTSEEFQKMIGLEFRKLVDLISIARSRKQVQQNYQADHLFFPERLQPIALKPNIDTENEENNISTLNDELKKLYFSAYKIWDYILDEHLEYYQEKYRQEKNLGEWFKNFRSLEQVGPLMRTNVLKRFESSIHAFKITIKKIKTACIERYEEIFKKKTADLESNWEEADWEDEEDVSELIASNWIKAKREHVDLHKMKFELEHDIQILDNIIAIFEPIDASRDQKLKEVIQIIKQKINNPFNEQNKKVIVFTSFVDTAKYLYENIKQIFLKDKIYCGLVTGDDVASNHPDLAKQGKIDIDDLLTYFSPRSKNLASRNFKQNITFEILIATDCISEGQDLQDCDFLINYDIHWNPVRIIQRFGRIDRIKSPNKQIQMVNVWPNVELDAYIKLEPKIESKMQKVGAAGTKDFEEESLKNQLSQLDQKELDLDNIQGENSFTHLTLSEFSTDLKTSLGKQATTLINQPRGIFALAKANEQFVPGIIFLFRLNPDIKFENNNPLNPYYLIYIDQKNVIRWNHNQATEILNIYKAIASNQKTVSTQLVEQFNNETNFGQNMESYQRALNKALEAITSKSKNEEAEAFLMGISTENEQMPAANDYQLISFLIIKE